MSNLEDLEKLFDLKRQGIISEEDFERKKNKILNPENSYGNKSQLAYVLLAFFLGYFGIHNFYVGRWKRGLTQLLITLLTFFIGSVLTEFWAVINIFTIHTDGHGDEFQPCKIAKYVFGIWGLLNYSAVIFIIATGMTFGYSSAMNKYRSNELLNYVSQVQIISMAINGGNGIQGIQSCDSLLQIPNEIQYYVGQCKVAPGGEISLLNVDQKLKKAMLKYHPKIHENSDGALIISF